MKKISMMVAIAALSLSFAACGGKSDAPKTDSADSTAVATPATTEEADALVKYEALVTKAIELQEKVKKGDAAALEEYTKLGEEMASISTELSQEIAKMTPEQAAKFTELGQKLAAAAN